ncbi:MAG: hypothetical protein NTW51_08520 [Cyanobacteria bacterium]|nr:hypothetical protein [Cyanobacteriota bacterium]
MSDHELGVRLREILLQERARGLLLEARRLQALVGDLCEHEQLALVPPLRHLLLSPAFLSELGRTPPLSEPRGRLRFLQELREVFATPLCDRMEAVVEGLLGLPASGPSDGSAPTDPTPATPIVAIPLPPPPPGDGAGAAALKAWPIALAGFLGGALLLALAGVLFWLAERNSPALQGAIPSLPSRGAGVAIGLGRHEASEPAASPEIVGLSGAAGGLISPVAVGSDPAAAVSARSGPEETPPAPVLPEGPGSQQEAEGQAAAVAAVRTVESLYQALSRQDFSAARALFRGEAADQFNPAFFRQFTRVEVADLQPTGRSAGSLTLDGVVSFFYPDGSLQKEARTFTLDTNSDPPRVVASAFGRVVRPRSPLPEPTDQQKRRP